MEDDDHLYFIRWYVLKDKEGRDASEGSEIWLFDPDLNFVKAWRVKELPCLEHGGEKDGLRASEGGVKHGILVAVPVSLMEKEGTYYFVLHFLDNHPDKYKDHQVKPALEMNAVYDPMIDAVSLHFHPSPDHNAHYDRHKYPLSNCLTMLRAIVRVTQGNQEKWFSRSRYTQQSADECWWPPLPVSPTDKWTWG